MRDLSKGRENNGWPSRRAAPSHLGHMFVLRGDLDRATVVTVVSEEAAAMHREHKHRSCLGDTFNNLGWAALAGGDHEKAKTLYGESLGHFRELGDGIGPSRAWRGWRVQPVPVEMPCGRRGCSGRPRRCGRRLAISRIPGRGCCATRI